MKEDNLALEKFKQIKVSLKEKVYLEKTESGRVLACIRQDHPIQKFFRKLRLDIPEVKKIKLDDYGSFVLEEVSKGINIEGLAIKLESKFGEKIQPTYPRLETFLRELLSAKIIKLEKSNK